MNTWCNQLHNAPIVFPFTQQSDNFTPGINGFNFPQPVLGQTVTSFSAFDPYPPPQYIQQWSASVQKSLGRDTTLEVGYHGEHGLHLQRSHLINNADPGPGRASAAPSVSRSRRFFPAQSSRRASRSPARRMPVSTVNMLENTARSWYNARIRQSPAALLEWIEPAGELHLLQKPERRAGLPLAHVRGGHSAGQQEPRRRKGPGLRRPPPLRVQRGVRHCRPDARPLGCGR